MGGHNGVRWGAEHPPVPVCVCPLPPTNRPSQTHLRGPERLRGDLQEKEEPVTVGAVTTYPLL